MYTYINIQFYALPGFWDRLGFQLFQEITGVGHGQVRASPGVGRLFSLTCISLYCSRCSYKNISHFPPPQGTGVAKRIGTVIRELTEGGGLIDGRCA